MKREHGKAGSFLGVFCQWHADAFGYPPSQAVIRQIDEAATQILTEEFNRRIAAVDRSARADEERQPRC